MLREKLCERKLRMKKQNKLVLFLFITFAIIMASFPLFSNTIFGVVPHDTFFHTQRIISLQKALEAGQFPVRIYAEIYNGYGYGASLFYPDIFLYIPAFLCMLGVPLATSYNIFLILINIATILIAYYSFSNITKSNVIGMLAAMLYALSTYRLVDLYTRSSIGECLALTFCPLAIWGFTAISRGEYKKWPVLAFAYTGLLQSHILSTIMMALVGVVWLFFLAKKFWSKKAIFSLIKAVGLTVLLNVWFLVPFLQVSKMNVLALSGSESYWQTGASFKQLWDVRCLTAAGRELYDYGAMPSMPKTPGVLLLVGALCFVVVIIFYKNRFTEDKKRAISYGIAGLATTLMVTYFFPWHYVKRIAFFKQFLEKFQFIWRFNILAILFLSVVAAYGFYYLFLEKKKHIQKIFVCILTLICLNAIPYLGQYMKQATEHTNEEAIAKSYMDWLYVVPGFYANPKDGLFRSNLENMTFSNVTKGYLNVATDFHYQKEPLTEELPFIEAPVTYYPGYKAYIDDNEVPTECSVNGVVKVYLPENVTEGTLYISYDEDTLTKIANMISLLSLITMLGFIIARKIIL